MSESDDDARWRQKGAPLFEQARQQESADVPPAALARAKAGLRERLELGQRPALFPRLALAGALAAVVLAVVVWKRAPEGPSIVVAEGSLGALHAGDRVVPGVELSSGAEAAVVALGEKARVQLQPGTRARVVSVGELALISGRTKVSVAEGPFKVAAAAVTLEVVGTVFEVACDRDEVTLFVSEGVVRASRGGQTWEVKAGETWPAPVRAPAPPEAALPERQKAQLTQLEQAQELTRLGKLDAARDLYGALAREDGSVAELALYHLAHLEQTRAHRPKVALEALDALLARFPNGALAHEAKLSRIEALRALGIDGGR